MRPSTATLAILTSLGAFTGLAALAGRAGSPPVAEDAWTLLGAIEIEEVEAGGAWAARKTYPEGLRDAASFEIRGHVVPVSPQPYLETFLLVPDPADCPFCGSAGYGPSLEVTMRRALPDMAEGAEIALRGTLELIADPETFQAVRLVDAVRTDGPGG